MLRSSSAEASGKEIKVGQDQSSQERRVNAFGAEKLPERSIFQGFLSFVKTMVDQQANAGELRSKSQDAEPGNNPFNQDKLKLGFAANETGTTSGPGAAWAGKEGSESMNVVQGEGDGLKSTPEGTIKGAESQQPPSPTNENGPEKSSTGFQMNAPESPLISDTDKKIGYFGQNEKDGADETNPLREIIQKTTDGGVVPGVLVNGADEILEKAEKITTPFEKMAEELKEQSPLNFTGDPIAGTNDKVHGAVDKVGEKAEEKAEKVVDKDDEKDERKDDRVAEKAVSASLKQRILNERRIEKERSSDSIEERDFNRGGSKKIDDDEEWKSREAKRNSESADRAEQSQFRPSSDYGMEIFGPYFAGLSDRVAGARGAEPGKQAAADQPIGRLKGVIHVNSDDVGSSTVISRPVLHIGAQEEPAGNPIGNFSSPDAGSGSLFGMKKGLSAYRALEQVVG
jgi:hypothetical protein